MKTVSDRPFRYLIAPAASPDTATASDAIAELGLLLAGRVLPVALTAGRTGQRVSCKRRSYRDTAREKLPTTSVPIREDPCNIGAPQNPHPKPHPKAQHPAEGADPLSLPRAC